MKTKIISRAKLHKMFEQEDECGKYDLDFVKSCEYDGLLYSIYFDNKSRNYFAVNTIRTVYMGLNSFPQDKIDEFESIMHKEGQCRVSWSCTGRTLHTILANQLKERYPQYDFNIDYNYLCEAKDPHRMVLQAGFEPIVEM